MTLKVSSVSCFRSGYKIIDNISFELKAGQLALISGSNGSGKTSLLRMIAGFIPLSFGSITFNSKEDYSNEFVIFDVKTVSGHQTIELITQPLVVMENEILKVTAGTIDRLHVVASYLEIT